MTDTWFITIKLSSGERHYLRNLATDAPMEFVTLESAQILRDRLDARAPEFEPQVVSLEELKRDNPNG